MVWVDRAGRILGRVGSTQMSMFFPEISPDGAKIAVSARDGEINDRDIWVHDIATGEKRLAHGAKGNDNFPVWSPDSREIIYTSSRGGGYDLYRGEKLLLKAPHAEYPRSWSPDGQSLLFTQAEVKREVYLLSLDGAATKNIWPKLDFWVESPRFSPNGKYIAYASNEGGPFEVYVAAFPDTTKKWKLSRPLANGWGGGGGQVRWRRDGRELFYMMGDVLLSVEVATDGEFKHQPPVRLFRLEGMRGNFPEEAPWLAKYDVAPDGGKFVFVRTVRK
jgi:eukaryotic-like serine/threonine-protein kinase